MNNSKSSAIEFDDLQGLLRFGYAKLTDSRFLLLNIVDAVAARAWLQTAPINSAQPAETAPAAALQIAFSMSGLKAIGMSAALIAGFPDEFVDGMSGDEGRSRRLGDVDDNAPAKWQWGGEPKKVPHVLLLFYALPGHLEPWQASVQDRNFAKAFKIASLLSDNHSQATEPFGFADGISQPDVDWLQATAPNQKDRQHYSNQVALGEMVLGYRNEYGYYTNRPLIDPGTDANAKVLADALDKPGLKDFTRNGTYLVLRHLCQDVPKFWQFLDQTAAGDTVKREQLAAAMVGRSRDGTPLVSDGVDANQDQISDNPKNNFTYKNDPHGQRCPIGAHIRRSNPRSADLPSGSTGFISRFLQILGFKLNFPDDDLVASARFHRLIRRGRNYGPTLSPEDALKPEIGNVDRGLHFICLGANISRQFEFVQNAWLMSSKFAAVHQEQDPLLGQRSPLFAGETTSNFNRPDAAGPERQTCALPQFITVKGGGYFFMPGLRALSYLANLSEPRS